MKLISKALIYRDLKYSKWFIPIISFVLLWLNMNSYLKVYYWSRFRLTVAIPLSYIGTEYGIVGTAILAFIMILMASFLFSFDRDVSSYSFAASMPFTRKEVIISKWLVGSFNIFFAYSFLYVMMNVLLIIRNLWKQCFFVFTLSFILNLLLLLCFYGFALLLQSINGTFLVGSLLSSLFVWAPYTFVYFLDGICELSDFTTDTYKFLMYCLDFIKSLLGIDASSYYFINWYLIKIIIYFVALIAMFFISIKLFNKSKLELNGKMITIKSMNGIYKIVMSYYAGALAHTLIFLSYGTDVFRIEFSILVFIVVSVPFYFLIDKVIKTYNKRYA